MANRRKVNSKCQCQRKNYEKKPRIESITTEVICQSIIRFYVFTFRVFLNVYMAINAKNAMNTLYQIKFGMNKLWFLFGILQITVTFIPFECQKSGDYSYSKSIGMPFFVFSLFILISLMLSESCLWLILCKRFVQLSGNGIL